MSKAQANMEAAFIANAPDPSPLEYFRMSELQGKPVPPREWLIEDWIPLHTTTLLYGDGGTGKSLLAQQLMTSSATGKKFLNMNTLRVPSLGFFCEDDMDEIHRRQSDINQHYNVDYSDLGAMACMDRVGQANAFVQSVNPGIPSKLPLLEHVQNSAIFLGARLVVIDTAADTFSGYVNDREQVMHYIQCLNGVARAIKGAVLLCAHPSATGLISGAGTGGSTAWSNTVRARLYLKHLQEKDDDVVNANMRLLSRKKSNYSAINNNGILLEWNEGVFMQIDNNGMDAVSRMTQQAKERQAQDTFLTCLDIAATQGRYVSDVKNSSRYAPKLFIKMPEVKSFRKDELAKAMDALFSKNKIKIGGVKGPDRHLIKAIVRVGESAGSVSAGSAGSDL